MKAREFVQEQKLKITRVSGNKAFAGDGIEIDLDKVDVAQDNNTTTIKPKKAGNQRANIRPGQTVQLATEQDIDEGINDPNIFKAIFLAGGPGAGKGYVYKNTMQGHGLKVVNPDQAYEFLMSKAGLSLSPQDIDSEKGQQLRTRAKELSDKQEELYKAGRLGLVVDGTAKDADKIAKIKTRLDALGYDNMMVFVNTDLETNLEQNKKRQRTLPDDMVRQMWSAVQKNMGRLQQMFGNSNFHIIDNSIDQRDSVGDKINQISKQVSSFLSTPPTKPLAQQWIEQHSK